MSIVLIISAMVIIIASIIFDRSVSTLIKQGRVRPSKALEVVRLVDLTAAIASVILLSIAVILIM